MSTVFNLKTSLEDGFFLVEGYIEPGGDIPTDIFVYNNTGKSELGEYYGVCSINEFTSLQNYDGTEKPVFGNRFLKHDRVKIKVDLQGDLNSVVSRLKLNVSSFATSFRNNIDKTYQFSI